MRFTKMEGLGNDYIYVNLMEEHVDHPEMVARTVSNRHFGIGSDGLVLIDRSDVADVRMIMYNADGSRGKMCGNAARCIGKYAFERGIVAKDTMTLETDAGIKNLFLSVEDGKVKSVTVDMGLPVFPKVLPEREKSGLISRLTIGDRSFPVIVTDVGNLHAVIFLDDDVENFDFVKYGEILQKSSFFPEGVNVEFVNRLDAGHLRVRVFERGSCVTLACGTGACAVAAAAIEEMNCDRSVSVLLDGGELVITWNEETKHLMMEGPARFICEGEYWLE